MNERIRGHRKILGLALMAILLASCGPQGMQSDNYDFQKATGTGLLDADRIPYTSGADPRVHEFVIQNQPKKPAQPSPQEQMRLDFSKSIHRIQMQRLGESQKPDRFGRKQLNFQFWIEISPGNLEKVHFQVQAKTGGLKFENLRSTTHPQFELSGSIEDSPEEDRSEGVFDLRRTDGATEGLARIYLRAYIADIHWTPKDDQSWQNTALKSRLDQLNHDSFAWVNNWAVALGRSSFDVQVLKLKSPGSLPDGEAISSIAKEKRQDDDSELAFAFLGEAKSTNEVEGHQALEITKGKEEPKLVVLKGDAEATDERVFEVQLTDPSTGTKADAMLEVEGPKKDPGLTEKKLKPENPIHYQQGDSLFRIPENSTQFPTSYRYLQQLEQNHSIPSVQKYLKYWGGKVSERPKYARTRDQMRKYFFNLSRVRDLIDSIFQTYDVLPHLATISVVESEYFFAGDFSAVPIGGGTDTGPMQILLGTGRILNMRVDSSQSSGKYPSRSDERRYLAPSLCGTAKHLRQDLKRFHFDHTWTLVAYNKGGAGAEAILKSSVNQAVSKDILSAANGYKMSFAKMAKLNMIPGQPLEYASRILAAYFVSLDPGRENFQFEVASRGFEPGLPVMPPARIQDSTCHTAAIKIVSR